MPKDLREGFMKMVLTSLLTLALLPLQASSRHPAAPCKTSNNVNFSDAADDALNVMRAQAEQMKSGGVALVAFMPGESLQSWSSKIVVVGRYKDLPTATDKGANLLGIAYAKASEMADTLKDSGSQSRPPMTGEFGWRGGVIAHTRTGYLIAAFSGGKTEDDLAVSRAGLAKLELRFNEM